MKPNHQINTVLMVITWRLTLHHLGSPKQSWYKHQQERNL